MDTWTRRKGLRPWTGLLFRLPLNTAHGRPKRGNSSDVFVSRGWTAVSKQVGEISDATEIASIRCMQVKEEPKAESEASRRACEHLARRVIAAEIWRGTVRALCCHQRVGEALSSSFDHDMSRRTIYRRWTDVWRTVHPQKRVTFPKQTTPSVANPGDAIQIGLLRLRYRLLCDHHHYVRPCSAASISSSLLGFFRPERLAAPSQPLSPVSL